MSQSNSKSNQPKQYSAEFKAKVVLEVLSGTKSFSQACRDYQISEQSLSNWKSLFLEKAATIFDKPGAKSNQSEPNELKIAELERMVGRLSIELEAAKKPTPACPRLTPGAKTARSSKIKRRRFCYTDDM